MYRSTHRLFVRILFVFTAFGITSAQEGRMWRAHDVHRPLPVVVSPAPVENPYGAPSDAIVLFDGKDLSKWTSFRGGDAPWTVRDGYMEVKGGSGDIKTRLGFGDVQLHLEWASPTEIRAGGQGRGNSGVLMMGLYEIQVLDSYENTTYADGQATSLYGQYPPQVNATRPPGEWQTYDIYFTRPRFDRKGAVTAPAYVTVVHNGVLVQNHVALWGETNWLQYVEYRAHPDRLPISLQDHGNPVRFRNIWVRPLSEALPVPPPPDNKPIFWIEPRQLEKYTGVYARAGSQIPYEVRRDSTLLFAKIAQNWHQLVPRSEVLFDLKWTDAHIEFSMDDDGIPETLLFVMGGGRMPGTRVPGLPGKDD